MKRYISLDVLRGLTVAFMVIVNNPGSICRYAPLCHSDWSGCTPTDLVFPFFIFCAGTAMAFSLSKFFANPGISGEAVKKILRRGLLIFLIGLGMNAFPFFPVSVHDEDASFVRNWLWWAGNVRIFGVLQRIGLCYILGGLLALWLRSTRKVAVAVLVLTCTHWLVLRLFGDDQLWCSLEGNISGSIDIAVVGENHVYTGYGMPFDPEGLLGVISATGTLLLGYIAGSVIRSEDSSVEACARIFALSAVCLALGCVWSIWLPINKPLWTGSYVLYAGGWALFVLGFLVYCIDVCGCQKIFTPFKIMGMNPLALFIFIGLFVRLFGRLIFWHTADGEWMSPLSFYYDRCCATLFGDCALASLIYSLSLASLTFLLGLWMYRHKIVIHL